MAKGSFGFIGTARKSNGTAKSTYCYCSSVAKQKVISSTVFYLRNDKITSAVFT